MHNKTNHDFNRIKNKLTVNKYNILILLSVIDKSKAKRGLIIISNKYIH